MNAVAERGAAIPRAPRRSLFRKENTLIFVALGVVLVLGVVPLLAMFATTFRPEGVLPLDLDGELTLENYGEVFASVSTYELLWNTVRYAVAAVVISLPIALLFAWLVERTNLPGRNYIYGIMFVPLVMPGFFTAIAWMQLAGKNAGAFNQYWRSLVGSTSLSGPLNVTSYWGLVFVTVLVTVPSMWLLLLGLFRNMDPALEEAASVSGARRPQTIQRITLPLLRPGTATVLVYYTLVITEAFEIPLILGLAGGYHVLSVQIFQLTTAGAVQSLPLYGLAATFGVIALIMGAALISVYFYAVRRQEKFATVSPKGYRPAIINLGRWKWLFLGLFVLYILLDIGFPVLVILWTSLHRFFSAPSLAGLETITFQNYTALFSGRGVGRMLINTTIVTAVSSLITMVLATLISWLTVRRPGPLTRALNALTFLPLAIPAPVAALGILVLYIRTPLYATLWIMVLAFVVRGLAFSTRLMHSAQLQIDKALDEAGYVSGAGPLRVFFMINLKLLAPSFINGYTWVFAHVVRDFTIPLFLATGATAVIANVIFLRFQNGDIEVASAYMIVLFVVVVALAMITRLWFRRPVSAG